MTISTELDRRIMLITSDPTTKLSAEAFNTLNGALSSHPWAEGKSELQRVEEVHYALIGRDVSMVYKHAVETLLAKANAQEQAHADHAEAMGEALARQLTRLAAALTEAHRSGYRMEPESNDALYATLAAAALRRARTKLDTL